MSRNAPVNAPVKLTETEKAILKAIEANREVTYKEINEMLSKNISTMFNLLFAYHYIKSHFICSLDIGLSII